ncbi:hypothetical protein ACJJTC_000903 [Scirpophaga incertulas]
MSEQLKTVSAMNKLYIGNLPIEADEAAVRQLFAEQNLTVADISVKRGGYAFVDFPDQSAADRAIDKLHAATLRKYSVGIVYCNNSKYPQDDDIVPLLTYEAPTVTGVSWNRATSVYLRRFRLSALLRDLL